MSRKAQLPQFTVPSPCSFRSDNAIAPHLELSRVAQQQQQLLSQHPFSTGLFLLFPRVIPCTSSSPPCAFSRVSYLHLKRSLAADDIASQEAPVGRVSATACPRPRNLPQRARPKVVPQRRIAVLRGERHVPRQC